jgi:signal transduction histidine kinase
MTDLLNDVLLLSKLEAQKLEAQLTEVDVLKVCHIIVEEFQSGLADKSMLEFSFLPEEIRAYLDEKLVRQIITNLLSNAFKYSPIGRRVQFTVSQSFEKALIFEIKDEGIGIPLADHPHLFEPFHRANNSEGVPGTGLGLSIVKHCVDLHQGEITFETTLNKGTTFVVKLPYAGI